ncbi:cell division protein ZapE [Rhodococcus sp. 15-2388-1-1a]|uniref:cell division protein ZapE n=1 Tax=Nocardiaceae TaxID=85025 RepID=UPI0009EC750F|nr:MULTISPECIES: cell division protein ZapE [Rhodococcus]OZF00225.1 cell division protein ZapE [Rhodococcus sp. 15-2388-1-1a]
MRPIAPPHTFDADFTLDDAQASAADVLSTPGTEGVYLWGPVGRGKTWLLDAYFAGAETTAKKRVHFHAFFRDLHAAYFRHRFSIDAAIDDILSTDDTGVQAELLCFDEFHVHDIGDARLITRMLDALFVRGVALVVTSNYAPDDLLPNPLYHPTFVPTIEKLKKNLEVICVDGPVDYRAAGTSGSRFASGSWSLQERSLRSDQKKQERSLRSDQKKQERSLRSDRTGPQSGIGGRTFADLCCTARSTGDYLRLFEETTSLTVTEVPALSTVDEFAAQRFANLVDVAYDRDVRVDFHALVPLDEFAVGCSGLDTDRLVSRLSELGSSVRTDMATATSSRALFDFRRPPLLGT